VQHRTKRGSRTIRTEDRLCSEIDRIVLAPCPFCGGVPAVRRVPSGTPGALTITCGAEGCPARPLVLGYSLAGAALVWNTRHTAWIPVAQALPRPCVRVLAVGAGGLVQIAHINHRGNWCADTCFEIAPSAWQPLPPVLGAVEPQPAAASAEAPLQLQAAA
jgi:hypothetical protein